MANSGRPPIQLTGEILDILNDRYAYVLDPNIGRVVIMDEVDGTMIPFLTFKRLGRIPELWLLSDDKRAFPSLDAWRADRRKRGSRTIDPSRADTVLTQPYGVDRD